MKQWVTFIVVCFYFPWKIKSFKNIFEDVNMNTLRNFTLNKENVKHKIEIHVVAISLMANCLPAF